MYQVNISLFSYFFLLQKQQLAGFFSGEIGLGEKQDGYAHILRPHPFYQLFSMSRFAYFCFTLSKFRFRAKITSFYQFQYFYSFSLQILLSVELFLANIDKRNVIIGNSVSNLKILFIYLFPGENEKSLALDDGLNEPTVGQLTCYICKTD